MLKGCQRRIIMVKDTGNPCFDAAYFVLREGIPDSTTEKDMLAEATRVLDACSVAEHLAKPKSKQHPKPHLHNSGIFLCLTAGSLGIITGAAATLLCCLT